MKNDEVGIFNPLSKDFNCEHSEFGKFKIPSREIVYFDPKIVPFIQKHLYNKIVNERELNGIKLNADPEEKKKITDEMKV